jgi:hypothetical protein
VILRAIEKDPADRFADADALANALAELVPKGAATAAPTLSPHTVVADPESAGPPPTASPGAVSLATQMQAEPTAAESTGSVQSLRLFLKQPSLAVEPGGSTLVSIILLNQGSTVEQVRLSVHGVPHDWLSATIPVVQLLPGMQQEISFVVRPPLSPPIRVGQHPLIVRTESQGKPGLIAEAKGTLTVSGTPQPPPSSPAQAGSPAGTEDGRRSTIPRWLLATGAVFLCVILASAAVVGAYRFRGFQIAVPPSESTPTTIPPPTITQALGVAQPTGSLPDLVVTRMEITLKTGGACTSSSTQLGVRLWIENVGSAPAGPFTVDVNGTKQLVTAGLAPQETTSLWFPGYVTSDKNSAYVDAQLQVEESNEDNNLLSQRLPIPTLVPTCTPSHATKSGSLSNATSTHVPATQEAPTGTSAQEPPSTDTPQPAQTPAPSPSPTDTPQPAQTPTPSPSPTDTPQPTHTRTPTPQTVALGVFNDFETPSTWKRGDQPNGTFTRSSAQAHGGSYSGELSYQFSTAGNDFVVFLWSRPLPATANQITAWVKGDGSGHFLNVWVKDKAGETWQFTFGRVNHTGWQQMTAYLQTGQGWPAGHITGPSDGVLEYPVSFQALVLDDVPDTYSGSGTIYVDDLAATHGSAPPATPLPGSATISFRADRTALGPGECTTLRWDVENVQGVYLGGVGVTGHGTRQVCPGTTTTYTLRVALSDGSTVNRTVTISVGGSASPPASTSCQAIPGETYGTLAVNGPPTDRPAAQHADLNLALRGYEPTTAYKGLVDYGGKQDPNAPQLPGLFSDNRTATFSAVYRVHDWNWGCNCRGAVLTNPEVTLVGLLTSPGEILRVPGSGRTIGSGYEVLVLHAGTDRITLQYTPEDRVVNGYTLHVENICVEPNLLALYQAQNSAGRSRLPALRAGQPFGRAKGSEIRVSIRDHGTFLDPRSRKDWWKGR